jgi:hypothetical protein
MIRGLIEMIKRNTSNFVHKIGDEIVIHSTSTGNNIFLNEVASDIYECVKDGASIDELLSRVGSIYQIDPALILSDVLRTIDALVQEGVVFIDSEEL